MKRRILIIIFSTLMLNGCEHKLSKEDLNWQPYRVGDLLIFESSQNEIDSIEITDIGSYVNSRDPLSPFSNKLETLFVSSKLLNPGREFLGTIDMSLLKMQSYEKDTEIFLTLVKPTDTFLYAETIHSLYELNYFSKTKTVNYGCISDVVLLSPNSTYKLEYDLKSYWWSKKYGYVRYDFKNGYYRKLKRFIRTNKNILPNCDNSK